MNTIMQYTLTYFTHACMALVKLYKNHNKNTASLFKRFETLFGNGKIIKRVTSAPYGDPDFIEISDFQKHILKITQE